MKLNWTQSRPAQECVALSSTSRCVAGDRYAELVACSVFYRFLFSSSYEECMATHSVLSFFNSLHWVLLLTCYWVRHKHTCSLHAQSCSIGCVVPPSVWKAINLQFYGSQTVPFSFLRMVVCLGDSKIRNWQTTDCLFDIVQMCDAMNFGSAFWMLFSCCHHIGIELNCRFSFWNIIAHLVRYTIPLFVAMLNSRVLFITNIWFEIFCSSND